MPGLLVSAFWITLVFLVAHVVLAGLLSAAALGVRGLLRDDHPARRKLLAFAKTSPIKSISSLKSPESILFYAYAAVLVLLTLKGAGA
jgi:hypothetical protein